MNRLKLVLLPLTRVRAYLPTISNLAILHLPLSSIIPALTKQNWNIFGGMRQIGLKTLHQPCWQNCKELLTSFAPHIIIDAGGMPQSTVSQQVLFQVWPKTIPSVDNPIITTFCLVSKEVGWAKLLVRSLIICLGPFYHSWAGERSESF